MNGVEQVQTPVNQGDYQPFPVDVFPHIIQQFIIEASKALQVDPAFIACPLLPIVAGLIGNTLRIELKSSWREPSPIWLGIVASSGSRKSPGLRLSTSVISDFERKLAKEYQQVEKQHVDKTAKILSDDDENDEVLVEQKEPPKPPQFRVQEITSEKLIEVLNCNPRGVVIAVDELSQLLGNLNRYSSKQSNGDESRLLSMFNAEDMRVDRLGRETNWVPMATCSIVGTIQPKIVSKLITAEHQASGLAPRLLLVYPPRTKNNRWTEDVISDDLIDAHEQMLVNVMSIPQEFWDDGKPKPFLVKMSPSAKKVWIEFYNEHNTEADEIYEHGDEDLLAKWSKLEGYCARFALALHVMNWGVSAIQGTTPPDLISEEIMQKAVVLAKWFIHETRRAYTIGASDKENENDRELLAWIDSKGGEVSPRDLQRHNQKEYPESGDAELELNDLKNKGYLDVITSPGQGKRSLTYRLKTKPSCDTGQKTATPKNECHTVTPSYDKCNPEFREEDSNHAPF